MPAGTLDRSPPPFFRQGPSALSQLCFFAALALFLMMADVRWQLTAPVRSALALALTPLQRALGVPVRLAENAQQYMGGLHASQQAAQTANARLVALSERANRVELLTIENQRLRALLELRPALQVGTLSAELLYESSDVFSRKVTIDRGSQHGLLVGSPVINEAGVLGQVTRVYPFTAEVTLLVDKDASIPVLNVRTQQRSVAFGGSNLGTRMELRYLTADTDIEPGDLLQTNGLDGVYPPNLPVGRVLSVTRKAESGFARVVVQPTAPEEGVRHVLVLSPLLAQLPPRPNPAAEAPAPTAERKLSTPRRVPSKAASAP